MINSKNLAVMNKYYFLLVVLFLYGTGLHAQNKQISGKIVDETGTPLYGVNITSKDVNYVGTISDIDGNFKLKITDSAKKFQISLIGFETKTITIEDKTYYNITLKESIQQLEEAVVIGYATVKKGDLTGSVGGVKSKDLEHQPITRIEQALSGRTSGVQIKSNSGAPGGNISIRIRGANSIKGNNQPLTIIDGVIGANLQLINPNDIESIQILKDASSTAIYGSRGANGVVIVTTKTGRNGKPTISFNTSQSISMLAKKIDYLKAGEFAELYNSYYRDLNFIPGVHVPPFSKEDIAKYDKEGGTDWQDELFRKAKSQNYQVSIAGGADKVKYYISGEYLTQEGIVVNSDFERFNLNSKVNLEITEKIDLGLNLGWSKLEGVNNRDVGSQLGAIGRLPQWVAIEPIWNSKDILYNNTPNYGAVTGNPVGIQNAYINKNNTNIFLPSLTLNYRISDDFKVKLLGSHENTNSKIYNLENNKILDNGPDVISRASINNIKRERSQVNLILDYVKNIGIHKIQATGIYESGSYIEEGSYSGANGLNSVKLRWNNLALSESQTASSYYYDEYYNSTALRFNYSLLDRYLLTATIRRDGVSKFKGDNQFSSFPSVALAWRGSEESFIKNLNLFSNLKLRGSYGSSGSHAIGSYATLPYFIQNSESNYHPNGQGKGTSVGLGVGAPGNEDLKWETTNQFNLGLELGFFNHKLNLELDYYDKKTKDLLVDAILPDYLGGESVLKNIGSISNKGVEVSLNTKPYNSNFFSWDLSANISINKNKVLDLGGEDLVLPATRYADSPTPITVLKTGEPLGSFYGYNFLGVWKTNETTVAESYGNVPGDAKYEDVNEDGQINSEDLKVLGNAQPDFIFGFSNNFRFGKVDFSFTMVGQKGGKTFNGVYQKSIGLFGQSRAFTSPDWYNRWRLENEDTDVPAFSSTSRNFPNSSRWLQDASFLRIQNITLAYNFQKDILSKLGLKEFQLYVNAENIYTFSNYKGYNPDASSAGRSTGGGSSTDVDQNIDTGAYPIPRTFTLGLKMKF